MVYVESKLVSSPSGDTEYGQWLEHIAIGRSEEEMSLICRAISLAKQGHQDQTRASGEPYLTHAVAVAEILSELRMDHESIAAAILHDVVEDTAVTLQDVEQVCGKSVASLVDGVTKMRVIGEYRESVNDNIKAESLRKLLLAMAEDVRVVLIKLADRLHNMRTLKHLPEEKRRRIARETMDIYAPLANRLGMWNIKWELEDLSFRHLDTVTYKQIANFLDERRVDRQGYIEEVITILEREVKAAEIHADIKGRAKHLYSIWKKMRRKGLNFHDLYDVRAIRVLVDTVADCYHVLGIVHSLWPHIPKEFDDYIATPKENLYKSIHTAVVGPGGKTLEVQIRTHEMDQHSELGVAAHWRYKEGGKRDQSFEEKIVWLRQLLEWKEEAADAGDFIDRFKSEVFQDRVYVLTPDGEVIDLPQGATPLDFAFYIHTEIGNRCRGAKVNGRIVTLTYELKSGEQVEILTTKQGHPSRDWLNPHLGYLKTSRARAKARHWFSQQDQQQNLIDGRAVLDKEMRHLGVEELALDKISKKLGFNTLDDLLISLGRGDTTTSQIANVVNRLTHDVHASELPLVTTQPENRQRVSAGDDVHIYGVGNLMTSIANCCQPAPGDPIIGFITLGRGVTIHRQDCPNVLALNEEKRVRLIEVDWSYSQHHAYPVDVEIQSIDRQGLLRDIFATLSNDKIDVLATHTSSDKQQHTATLLITLEITDIDQLSKVLSRIGQIPNVLEVRRRR